MKTMRLIHPAMLLLTALLALSIPPRAHAAQAAFSPDGNHVFIPDGNLMDVDLKTGRSTEIKIPQEVTGAKANVRAITRAGEGKLVLLAPRWLIEFDPATRQFKALPAEPGEKTEFTDLAWNPADKNLYITAGTKDTEAGLARGELLCLVSATHKITQVNMRRVDWIQAPVFDAQGHFFYSFRGDLWEGGLDYENTPLHAEEPAGKAPVIFKMPTWLTGARVAPLARLETSNANSGSTGVFEIAPAADGLFVHTKRIGGSGWGKILQLTVPDPQAKHDDGVFQDFVKTLSGAKILGENGANAKLCASADGRKVFYRAQAWVNGKPAEKLEYWLIENGGQPRPLKVK